MKWRAEPLTGGIFALPWFLAVTMRAHAAVFRARGQENGSLECTISVQGRKRGARGPIFQNQVSQLFFARPLADLASVEMYGADLSGADLEYADLANVDHGHGVAPHAAATVNGYEIAPGVNLSGADLRWAWLTEANLSGADLSYAILDHADLYKTNLTGANLTRADLVSANLGWAKLTKANLYQADLKGLSSEEQ
jgi:uncharacterized protein YjbI with pentapeptide repeats